MGNLLRYVIHRLSNIISYDSKTCEIMVENGFENEEDMIRCLKKGVKHMNAIWGEYNYAGRLYL